MTDRELLEAAAKAAGVNVWTDIDGNYYSEGFGVAERPWNPLTDDGDALRLAVKLKVATGYSGSNQYYAGPSDGDKGFMRESGERNGVQDPYAAARRAIVRAAAAIGSL